MAAGGSNFDPSRIRIYTEIGSPLLFAHCVRNDCTWRMAFSHTSLRLDFLNETCAAHPCQGEKGAVDA